MHLQIMSRWKYKYITHIIIHHIPSELNEKQDDHGMVRQRHNIQPMKVILWFINTCLTVYINTKLKAIKDIYQTLCDWWFILFFFNLSYTWLYVKVRYIWVTLIFFIFFQCRQITILHLYGLWNINTIHTVRLIKNVTENYRCFIIT